MKIPKDAKLVFKGQIFDVYQWKQTMFDGSYETFECLKRPNSVEVIAVQGGKIFVCEQEQPGRPSFYSLFGGRFDEGEKPLEAAKRELLEESGLASDDWELLSKYDPVSKIEWNVYMFIARKCKKINEPKLEAGERISAKKVGFKEFLSIVDSEKFRNKYFANEVFRMKFESKLEAFKKRLLRK